MKTTEVFVEQVLIGFLVLLIGALPFVGAIPSEFDGLLKIIGSAIGVVGMAYLLGIPFDRFADTVLSSLERRNRLAFSAEHRVPKSGDPFPASLLRIAVQQANDGTVAWLEYLRSRIRLARAVAVFAPGLTLSAILATWPESEQSWYVSSAPRWAVIATLGSSCVIYAMAFLWAIHEKKTLPGTKKHLKMVIKQKANPEKQQAIPGLTWKHDPVPWLLLPFVAIGVTLAVVSQSGLCVLVGVVGLLITVLTGWSWWRITKTYMTFLVDFERWQQQQAAKKAIV